MFGHEIIVVGASAGGVDAIPRLIASLPTDLPASVFVVLHVPVLGPDLLAEIVGRRSVLPVSNGVDGEEILPGHVYVAPPDMHLQLEIGHVRLNRGPRENRHRPAIDALFRSAAEAYGPRVTGVVLTGHLDDGTAGLNSVKTHGGVAIVQDPKDSLAPGMPESALRNVQVDHCVPLAEIGPLLVSLATARTISSRKRAVKVEKRSLSPSEMEKKFGRPTAFVCPECNGPLWETKTGQALQFRCHVGHAYSPESLMADHADGLERALWSAVRTFDEQAALLRRLKERRFNSPAAPANGPDLETRAVKFEADADAIRKLLQAKR
ncbi:MAG: chemotaxis protein CheB [Burkholderiales bacterium]|nr:chemotaxis protein CheB [Opitutaceae bacterium]